MKKHIKYIKYPKPCKGIETAIITFPLGLSVNDASVLNWRQIRRNFIKASTEVFTALIDEAAETLREANKWGGKKAKHKNS